MKQRITTITTIKANNNIFIAYALWFFLGWAGAHRIYTGRNISGFLILGLNIFATLLVATIIGVVIAFPIWMFIAIWWAIDPFIMLGWGLKNEAQIIKEVETTN